MRAAAWRVPLGFVLAPVVPCACVAVAIGWADLDTLMFLFKAMLVVCWVVTAIVGVPAYLMLGRLRQVTLRECLTIGTASAVALVLLLNGGLTAPGIAVMALVLLPAIALGASIALCFWWIALRVGAAGPGRRPAEPAPKGPGTARIRLRNADDVSGRA